MESALLASDRKGLWARDRLGEWRPRRRFLDGLEVVGSLMVNDVTFAATTNGLMRDAGGKWTVVAGMSSVVTDIEIVPDQDVTRKRTRHMAGRDADGRLPQRGSGRELAAHQPAVGGVGFGVGGRTALCRPAAGHCLDRHAFSRATYMA